MALTPALLKEITEVLESMDDNQLKDAEFMLNYLRKLTPEQREEFNKKVDARLKELDEMDAQTTPPHADLIAEIRKRWPDEKFIEEYHEEFTRQKILDKYRAADPTMWDDLQNLYDEYCYFEAGFDAVAIKL